MSTPTPRVPRGTFKRSHSCGWTGTYNTAGRADYAKRQHSCDLYRQRAAAAERGAARMAAVDRTPKPCHHKRANHQHGTYACYTLDACRCEPCAAAVREYEQNRVRRHAYGRWDHWTDADPVRQHVRSLMAAGMGLKRIVAVSDASQGQLWKLLYGRKQPDGTRAPSKRIRRDVAERLLAIEVDLVDGARVDSTGTTRRIRALVALGWSQSQLAARLGIARGNFRLAHGDRGVTAATARAVRDLYEELSMQLPPTTNQRERIAANRARNYAAARGWLPPLALDDERLDDPTYKPASIAAELDDTYDEAVVERRLSGDRTVKAAKADRVEIVRRAREAGWSYLDIERRAGISQAQRYITREDAAS